MIIDVGYDEACPFVLSVKLLRGIMGTIYLEI
jgi:hypothetical protein